MRLNADKEKYQSIKLLRLLSSPEHEVLMVSYCDQSLSVVRRPCVVNFLL